MNAKMKNIARNAAILAGAAGILVLAATAVMAMESPAKQKAGNFGITITGGIRG